jgi:hypothetical protein
MRKIDLGQTITILANIGVIAGIVFLALELRQNTVAVQGATYQALSDGISSQYSGVAHDPVLGQALARVYRGDPNPEFSAGENSQIIWYYNALIQRLENSYFQWQTGLVDDRVLEGYGWNDGVLTTRHFSNYWSFIGASRNTSPEFRRFFEAHVNLWKPDQTE